MSAVWNVRDRDGVLVDDLAQLARTLRTDTKSAARLLDGDPDLMGAAPEALRQQVKAATKPGDGTPPPISSGSFVAWDGGKGRVDLLVTNGKVPGVSEDVEGTEDSPAARVVVYENGIATGRKIGASTHTLKRIPPIAKATKTATPADLVRVLTEHDATCDDLDLPSYARVTGFAVKSVYDRGLSSYPGQQATSLPREEWAMGRVRHFVKVAALDVPRSRAGHDVDLLAPEHPLHKPLTRVTPPPNTEPVTAPEGTVRLDPAAVEQQIRELTEDV